MMKTWRNAISFSCISSSSMFFSNLPLNLYVGFINPTINLKIRLMKDEIIGSLENLNLLLGGSEISLHVITSNKNLYFFIK